MSRTVGIVGLPELARVLRQGGVEVYEGEQRDARAVSPISDQLHRGHQFPVLVAAAPVPGLVPWAGRMARLTDLWVVRPSPDDSFELPEAAGWLDLPMAVGDLLDAVGLDHAGLDEVVGHEIAVDGVIRPGGNGRPDAEGSLDPAVDGMARSTCAHCGEQVYGVASRQLWWHLGTREAACRTGGSVATPAVGPPPPPDVAASSAETAAVEDRVGGVGTGRWTRDGAIVFSAGAKGGVGKTTMALALATAAAERGLDVVLVDANRGQGDVAHYLRLSGTNLRTVYDAAITGHPADALASPEEIERIGHHWLDPVEFSLVLAPSNDHQAEPDVTTAEVYADVVRHAATTADLVVVDTQILDRVDTSGLVDRLIAPLLEESAWLLAVTDLSSASIVNTRERLEALQQVGVSAARVLVVANRVDPDDAADVDRLGEVFTGRAEVLPAVESSTLVPEALNAGRLPTGPDRLREVVDDVLLRATGNPAFAPPEVRRGRLRTWWRRRRRRRA